MNSVRRAFVSTVLAGALALGGGAMASAAPATAEGAPSASAVSVSTDVAVAQEWYYGSGFGFTESAALLQAQEQAYFQAWLHGGWERWQCSVTSSWVVPSGNTFNARVTLICW
ncbi:hypothetical protein FHR81_000260 [Actinoalloteichus hoggarensis]|uniref:Uncharacterized protein n=1 Tax=Actinoalloteichus hoggarensis TaxID=1470176 RepID=A0A221W2P3_9PSEU|nr:hypothetical protein [Actinoalloteichus hoggarensis]ASO20058.1 hypothetical protein AHOG_12075 [Actinoalloteichus hoggarensis]MBB5919231.1 hypothetical protein [Actinoalloteichus hoggarensis]